MFNSKPHSNGKNPSQGQDNKLGLLGRPLKKVNNVKKGDDKELSAEELNLLLEEEPDIEHIRDKLEEWGINTTTAKKHIKGLVNRVSGSKKK